MKNEPFFGKTVGFSVKNDRSNKVQRPFLRSSAFFPTISVGFEREKRTLTPEEKRGWNHLKIPPQSRGGLRSLSREGAAVLLFWEDSLAKMCFIGSARIPSFQKTKTRKCC